MAALTDRLLAARVPGIQLLPDSEAIPACSALLSDPPKDKQQIWGPRLLWHGLRRLRSIPEPQEHTEALKNAIDALIGRIEQADGRALVEIGVTLRHLTGKRDFPDVLHVWESWWKNKRETWVPADPKKRGNPPTPGRTSVVRYHGLEVDSLRLSFLIDASGGMSRDSKGEFDGKGPTRLDHCKKELSRTLNALPARAFANIIRFGSYFESCSRNPLQLAKGKKKLLNFVDTSEVSSKRGHNRGNLYDTLLHACQQPHVDTIYLLSEGAPTEGKYLNYERFLKHFKQVYRYHPVRIHILSIGGARGRNSTFLRNLSNLGGGTYREIQMP